MFPEHEEPLKFLNVVQSWKKNFFNSKRKFIRRKNSFETELLEVRNTCFTTYCIFFKFSEFEYFSSHKFENSKNLRNLGYPEQRNRKFKVCPKH